MRQRQAQPVPWSESRPTLKTLTIDQESPGRHLPVDSLPGSENPFDLRKQLEE